MKTLKSAYAAAVLALVLLPNPTLGVQDTGSESPPAFKVIVNISNPAEEIPRDQLRRIFLRTMRLWPHGGPIRPVDQSLAVAVRGPFSERVLEMSLLAVRHYWTQQIFSGGEPPPPTRDSDQAVVAFVDQNGGAVGYVSSDAALTANVKELGVTW